MHTFATQTYWIVQPDLHRATARGSVRPGELRKEYVPVVPIRLQAPKPALPSRMEEQVDTRTLEEVQHALSDLMCKHFRPVTDGREVSQMLTTEQMLHMVNSHSPDLVPPKMFREAMLGLGYTEKLMGNEFRWLLGDRD